MLGETKIEFDKMSDVVEGLRAGCERNCIGGGTYVVSNETDNLMDEAADEIERLRGAARFAHAAIKIYHTMYPHRATGALLDAAGRLWEVLDYE
jgi:nucleoside-diphosphate-sugar epimerase